MSNIILNVSSEVLKRVNINMNNILLSKDINKQISEMNKAFSLTRSTLVVYPQLEKKLLDGLRKCNRQMSDYYIMAFDPNFKQPTIKEVETLKREIHSKYSNNYYFLNDFIKLIRIAMISMQEWAKYGTIDFKRIRMNKHHTDICLLVKKTLDEIGIKNRIYNIYVGFDKNSGLKNYLPIHPFNIVNLNGTNFILDFSYQDFFLLKDNMLNALGIQGYPNPLPGIYMLQESSRMHTAGDLLNQGFIEATKKNLKNYFDGFVLSFRNGLYYENSNPIFITDYTDSDYKDFLSGKDSQLRKEGEKVLGTQRFPLEQDYLNRFDGMVIYQNKAKKLVKTI